MRICLNEPHDANVQEMHISAKVLSLKIRQNIALLKLMLETVLQDDSVVRAICYTRTRSSSVKNLAWPSWKTEWLCNSVSYQGPLRWSNLPVYLKKNLNILLKNSRKRSLHIMLMNLLRMEWCNYDVEQDFVYNLSLHFRAICIHAWDTNCFFSPYLFY